MDHGADRRARRYVTVLCYGYWLREEGRTSRDDLRGCRIDLGAGYRVTAMLGSRSMIVGSSVHVEGEGTQLLVICRIARASSSARPAWLFLIGATRNRIEQHARRLAVGPVFVRGLLAAVAAGHRRLPRCRPRVDTRSRPYRVYLVLLAIVPMLGLFSASVKSKSFTP